MKVPVEVPFVGESIVTMHVLKWHKAVGADVLEREPLVEMTTDKIDFTIDAPVTGELSEIRAGDGAEVRPKDVIAMIAKKP